MSAACRFLLSILLALLLPLQGFAAVSMMACVPPGQPAMSGGLQGAAPAPDAPTHEDHCAPDSGDTAASSSHSSTCAACCVAAALASPALPAFSYGYLYERPPGVRAPAPAFITDGTDRPPRLTRA